MRVASFIRIFFDADMRFCLVDRQTGITIEERSAETCKTMEQLKRCCITAEVG